MINDISKSICDTIYQAVEKKNITANKDMTYLCTVTEVYPGTQKTYRLTYEDTDYTVTLNNINPKLYDKVHLVIPQGDFSKKYVLEDVCRTYAADSGATCPPESYPPATQTTEGLMSAADKKKLDGIATGANNYSLPAASPTVRGGVKVGYTQNGKNYPVQLSNEQMYVNVPWTDTNTDTNTWKANTKDSEGYVAKGLGQANKVWKTDADGNPAWRDDANTSAVTGVKGNAESTYRTGSVNITPANIGLGNVNNTADSNKSVNKANVLYGGNANNDLRNEPTTPNDYNSIFKSAGIKTKEAIGETDGSTLTQVIGYRAWPNSTGGKAHELGFTGNGNLYHRAGSATTWENWREIAHVDSTVEEAVNADTVDGKHASDLQNYNNLTNKPAIPTKTSQLTNDSGFKTTDNNTWKANTKDSEGYVAKGSGNANKVWGTDKYGNPGWVDNTVDKLAEIRRKVSYYGICSTDGGTAAKTVTVDDSFALEDDVEVIVKFVNNTHSTPSTLNINGTGAKKLYYKGNILQTATTIPGGAYYFVHAGGIYTFRYNSSGDSGNGCWELTGDLYNPISSVSNVTVGLMHGLEVKFNGQTQDVFMGNTNKSINITPGGIGAAEYEEGTWTPDIYYDDGNRLCALSVSSSYGLYEKVGRLVHLKGRVTLTTATDKTEIYIKGLPFTMKTINYPLNFMLFGGIYTSTSTTFTQTRTMSPVVIFNSKEIIQFRNSGSGARSIYVDIAYSIL